MRRPGSCPAPSRCRRRRRPAVARRARPRRSRRARTGCCGRTRSRRAGDRALVLALRVAHPFPSWKRSATAPAGAPPRAVSVPESPNYPDIGSCVSKDTHGLARPSPNTVELSPRPLVFGRSLRVGRGNEKSAGEDFRASRPKRADAGWSSARLFLPRSDSALTQLHAAPLRSPRSRARTCTRPPLSIDGAAGSADELAEILHPPRMP